MPRHDNIVPSYVAKLVKKVKLQMIARVFDPKDLISITGVLATFELVRDTNEIHENAAE